MVTKERLPSTLILLAAIILTLIMGLALESAVLALIFSLVAWLAYGWYLISYIPFAQKAVKSCLGSCMSQSS